jgi:hypothetical protein
MPGNYSYYEIIRRTSAAFGTLFNDIYIRHQDDDNEDFNYIKVPLAYGPIQKFLARIEQKPESRNRVAITLPRMSFQIGKLSYDSSRKSSSTQTFKAGYGPNNTPANIFMPIPYILPFELSIATKNNDDMFQIIEQILPRFRPEYTLSVNLVSTLGDTKDIPIVLQDVGAFQDDYDGAYDTRRFIQCALTFAAKIYFYGTLPYSGDEQKLIKKVQVDYYADTKQENASRQLRYIVTPRAVDDYNQDETTTLFSDISAIVSRFPVSDATQLEENSYIQIDNENMLITNIEDDYITVARGKDGTIPTEHQEGSIVNVISSQDDELIQLGDDFEFNEETFNFDDGKIYSPRKGEDV